jgi:radical SAM protein with 4Fe4S-binding SPASM domain
MLSPRADLRSPSGRALAVMARRPRAGRVKRRLAETIGAAPAARVYARLLADTLQGLSGLDARLVVALAPEGGKPAGASGGVDLVLRRDLAAFGIEMQPDAPRWDTIAQRGATLGERLAAVFDDLFGDGHDTVVVVGSDSPALPREYVHEAFARLDEGGGLVCGPAADGGFYLVGCAAAVWSAARKTLVEALKAAPLGSTGALAHTVASARAGGLAIDLLPMWIDVDEARDLPVMERLLAPGDEGLRGLPLVGLREIYLHVTNRCMTGCPHCYNETNPRQTDELTAGEWTRVIDECVALGATSFVFLGGDPLLRTDLLELIAHVTDRHAAKARFFFNSAVDELMATALAAAGHGRLRPLVSVDGTRAVNDSLRGAGNFEDAMRSIANLRAVGLVPVANAVVLRPVLPVLPDLARELGAAGVERLHLIFPHQRGGLGRHLDLVPSGDEMLAALRALDAACDEAGVVFDNLLAWRRRLSGRQDLCTAGCRDLAIDPYGKVSACTITCGDPAFVAGDVRRERLERIWRDSPAFRLLRASRARDREECAACSVVDACGGECWMQAHYAARAHRDPAGFGAPFPYCDLLRPVFETLFADREAVGLGSSGAAAACGGQAAAGDADFTLFDCI